MKKIFTLIAATVLTVATTFAADRRPSVTLKSSRNYEVVIDGKSYSTSSVMQLPMLRSGQHSIKVYQQSRGGFGFFSLKTKRLIDASSFTVGRSDVDINVDFRGQITISQDRFGQNKWDDQRSDRYDHNRNDQNRHF